MLESMPMSYGNSCFLMGILLPFGPSRYPPSALDRRIKVRCRSISQLSIVVTFVHIDQMVRMSNTLTAKQVNEFVNTRRNSNASWIADGPRYYFSESRSLEMQVSHIHLEDFYCPKSRKLYGKGEFLGNPWPRQHRKEIERNEQVYGAKHN